MRVIDHGVLNKQVISDRLYSTFAPHLDPYMLNGLVYTSSLIVLYASYTWFLVGMVGSNLSYSGDNVRNH